MKCPKCQAENPDRRKFCRECGAKLIGVCPQCGAENPPDDKFCGECGFSLTEPAIASPAPPSPKSAPSVPTSFASGRYQVKKFLGEGGKKKVYLAHDTVLDRDVAFALIKTEKLDESARTRIKREVQSMGRLGDHPHMVNVYDFGDHEGQPFIVLPLLPGGDIEGLIKNAPDHKLPLDKCMDITRSVCKGLEFAHGKGIIHRDIKPGNVWMSADGTAKVGDFGLAVAVDLSRLTQAGMMVGTVSYMPPEQAMGGKVTAKADLYSLGAMLYEMVTGRPPFVGDDPVAIIGQHINTPPVSPTWHRADLPPALETLIMQLLEKDPEKRPASATVVLQALESIRPGKTAEQATKEPAVPAENPLYRRVFVGREAELKQLQSAFDGAMSGQGALMMVLGEPGVGKTALCEQLATYVSLKGGRTLVGHCYEEGSLSRPYLAFVEAMRSYVLARDVKCLREELGTGAADVARIVSEIRERLKLRLRAQKDREEERYRLMQAVTTFLTNAASMQSLLVVLEDLHDADKGTLDMLTHVSRHLAGARLLVVGTYRDVAVDRTHPLSAALAELRRGATFGRVVLRGLNADEVRRMLESITRESVPWSLAEAVHRQTEGNPLFVQEVVRFLAEEGLISQREGRWSPTRDASVEMNIPEGLRDVIGKRISLLSPECNQVLSVASVIGREFALETLRAVAAVGDDLLVEALKEAVRLSVLEERTQVGDVRYRFAHAFFRQTLYEEMIAPQRLKLHQQVARALEVLHATRLYEHAAELAEHFSQSTDPPDLEKAIEYGEMAAKRSMEVFAYGEAVRLLDQALKVQRVLDPAAKEKTCDLLLDLCDALLEVPDTKRILDKEAPAAATLSESIGDSSRAVRSCTLALSAITGEHGLNAFNTQEFAEWARRADRHAQPGTLERARADWALGCVCSSSGDHLAAKRLLTQALDVARQVGDPNTLWLAGGWLQLTLAPTERAETYLPVVEELLAGPRTGLKSTLTAGPWCLIGSKYLCVGQRERADAVFAQMHATAERTGNEVLLVSWQAMDAMVAVIDGRLEEATQIAQGARARANEAGVASRGNLLASIADMGARIYLGASVEAIESWYRAIIASVGQSAPNRAMACFLAAHLGREAEVSEKLEQLVINRPRVGTEQDLTPLHLDTLYLQAAVHIGHRRAVELLLDRFANSNAVMATTGPPACIPRHTGAGAALLGRFDEARTRYQEAIRVCAEMRFRPELALTRLQLAELLLDHFPAEKQDALEQLDFAIKEFREMKMQPSLERALRRKEILRA